MKSFFSCLTGTTRPPTQRNTEPRDKSKRDTTVQPPKKSLSSLFHLKLPSIFRREHHQHEQHESHKQQQQQQRERERHSGTSSRVSLSLEPSPSPSGLFATTTITPSSRWTITPTSANTTDMFFCESEFDRETPRRFFSFENDSAEYAPQSSRTRHPNKHKRRNTIPFGFKAHTPRESHEFPFRIDEEIDGDDDDMAIFHANEYFDESPVIDEMDELRRAYLANELGSDVDLPDDQVKGWIPRPKPSVLSDPFIFEEAHDQRDDDDDDYDRDTCRTYSGSPTKTVLFPSSEMFFSPYDGDYDFETDESDDEMCLAFGIVMDGEVLSGLSSASEYETDLETEEACFVRVCRQDSRAKYVPDSE